MVSAAPAATVEIRSTIVGNMKSSNPSIFSVLLATLFWSAAPHANAEADTDALVRPQPDHVGNSIQRYVEESRLAPGVVVGVIHDGRRAIYSYGDSGRESLALDQDTQFEIGSISKVFTGLLLAEMALNGEVDYGATVAELAPDGYSFGERVGAITLEQLATHTSGIPRLAMDPGPLIRGLFTADPYAGSTPEEIFQSVAFLGDDRLGAQGEFAYSNLGYGLLAQLLAEAAGQDFAALLTERVLVPLQLDSGSWPGRGLSVEAGAGLQSGSGGTALESRCLPWGGRSDREREPATGFH